MLIFGWNTENIHWEKEKLSIFHGNFRLQYHRIADSMLEKTACVWKRKMWELALRQKKKTGITDVTKQKTWWYVLESWNHLLQSLKGVAMARNQAFDGHQKPLPQTEFPLDEAHTPKPKGYRVDLGSASVTKSTKLPSPLHAQKPGESFG